MFLRWIRYHQQPASEFDNENIIAVRQREFEQASLPPAGLGGARPHGDMVQPVWRDERGGSPKRVVRMILPPSALTNQRETTILWEKATGPPFITPLCGNAAALHRWWMSCSASRAWQSISKRIPAFAGCLLFRNSKSSGFMDHVPAHGARTGGRNSVWHSGQLAGVEADRGKVHVTDRTNASRTMLYNIHKLDWDDTLLNALDIPAPCCRV